MHSIRDRYNIRISSSRTASCTLRTLHGHGGYPRYSCLLLEFGLVDSYNLNGACMFHEFRSTPRLQETMRWIGCNQCRHHLGQLHRLQRHKCKPQPQLRILSSSHGLFRLRRRQGSFSRREISSHRAKEEGNPLRESWYDKCNVLMS